MQLAPGVNGCLRLRSIAAVAFTLVVTLVVTLALTASAGARPAANFAVVSGDARFEVLSPTLIRTEYSGSQSFVDGATFNVIGRDDFSPTHFTSSVSDGWLTITTSAMTLRYRVGSGRFTADNLVVSLHNGGQAVTAQPWASANPCEADTLCEAEDATLNGVGAASDHNGFTGTGFAAGWQSVGNSLTQTVNVATGGDYEFQFRYANSLGGDGLDETRTLSLVVDGGTPIPLTLPTTASWDDWSILSADLGTLTAGQHTIEIVRNPSDSGNVNIDSFALTAPGANYPAASTCKAGDLCEAEDGTLQGVTVASDHNGFTGKGFAAGWQSVGNSLTQTVDVATAGDYEFQFRYANSLGGDGLDETRTLSLVVDGGTPIPLTMPTTASWDDWSVLSADIGTLTAGQHTIEIVRNPGDSGNVNMDSFALTAPGADYPTASSTSSPCPFGSVCSGSVGTLGGGASVATNHNGYTGQAGFVTLGTPSSTDAVQITGVPAAGGYDVQLRYSDAGGADQAVIVTGHGNSQQATLPQTTSWDAWRTVTVPVTLSAGTDTVTLSCPNTSGVGCGSNVDTIAVVKAGSPIQAPHAPLGGYRRGLDGQNSPPSITPGLLYQDGWYMLNDTASALFNPVSRQVTQRPADPGYEDGYVFAYGQDYRVGLKDLATLTGPSELLPRWAYGVWYSEYYNHTAADYENTILPDFRSNHVPLDVLVTDTDFKSPNAWDGWEMNPTEFPDPTAYFAWAHSMGLHTALNIHSSVAASDPQFAQAQSTAGTPLIANGSGDCPSNDSCFAFDWGQPDQLKAYFDLHNQLRDEGNDIWWLDWCCDGSISSLPGVTPDAWINQNYKWYTDPTLGRGFALSRAYFSLQDGGNAQGLPTGPWADKRTTIHFTGDAGSNWAMLAFEVGYTPGESVATGLSPVSNDIGGFNNVTNQIAGAEPGSTQDPPDLYARWVQLGAFEPILRLHGNHSDRLPWQYPADADASASRFLNLREDMVPYIYTAAQQATRTGVPVTQPLYLDYPDQQDAYGYADSEYMFGPSMLVAPVTTPGTGTVGTTVWFPPGEWTDYFTGQTYTGPSVQTVNTDLSTMPVFIKAGGIVPMRTSDVTNDEQNPLTNVTLNVAADSNGAYSLYEDNGTTTDPSQSATTEISYQAANHTVTIDPVSSHFAGQVTQRTWTVKFYDATAPTAGYVDGHPVPDSDLSWDPTTGTVTITTPRAFSVNRQTTVSYR